MSNAIVPAPAPSASLTHARIAWTRRPVSVLVLMLFVFAAIGLYYVRANPPYEAPEEALHLALVRDMAAGREPLFGSRRATIGEEQQPRAYYLLLMLPVGWAEGELARWLPAPLGLAKGPGLALTIGRLTSLLFGTGALIATYLLVCSLARKRSLALGAVGFQMLIPGFVLTSSTVNNDNAANLFGALSLWLGTRVTTSKQAGWQVWLVYSLCVVAAAFSKLTAIFVIPFFVATLLIAAWRHGSGRAKAMLGGALAIALGVPVVVGAVDPSFRLTRAVASVAGGRSVYSPGNVWWAFTNNSPASVLEMLAQLTKTSTSVAGWQNSVTPPTYVYLGAAILGSLVVFGIVRYAVFLRGWRSVASSTKLAVALLAGVEVLVILQLYLVGWGKPYATYHWGITHARYLFPVLGFTALTVVGGLSAVCPRRLRQGFLTLLFLVMLAYAVTIPFYRTADQSGPLFNERAATMDYPRLGNHPLEPTPFAAGITLLDSLVGPTQALPGKPIRVRLLWRADVNSNYDFRAFVHVVDSQGNQVAGSDVTPTGYRFPTRLWRQGDILLDDRELQLPRSALPGKYDIIAGVYSFDKTHQPVISAVQKPSPNVRDNRLTLGKVIVPQAHMDLADIPIQTKVGFGDDLLLQGMGPLAENLRPGDDLSLTLYWQSFNAMGSDWQISVQILDSAGRLVAQQDGQPQQGRYPTSIWQPGEIVPDAHLIPLPATLESGSYNLLVVVYRLSDQLRLQTAQPQRPPSDSLPLGVIQVGKR